MNRDAPYLSVRVRREGQGPSDAIDVSDRVIAMEYLDEERKLDAVHLTVDNGTDWWAYDSGHFRRGNVITISWGWPGDVTETDMIVVGIRGGAEEAVVEGVHPLWALHDVQRSRIFENVSTSDVVTRVLEDRGMGGKLFITPTKVIHSTITQAKQTDAQFLRSLARREGCEFFSAADGIHFVPRSERLQQAPVRKLTYFVDDVGSILDLRIESKFSEATKGKITRAGIDPATKRQFRVSATNETAKPPALASVIEIVDGKTGQTSLQTHSVAESVAPSSARSEAAAQRQVDAQFRRQPMIHELGLTVVGDVALAASRVIEVSGIGQTHSGRWYVRQARHLVSAGEYVVELTCGRQERNAHVDTKKDARTAGGVNSKDVPADGKLKEVEVVDRRTGESHVEWRRG